MLARLRQAEFHGGRAVVGCWLLTKAGAGVDRQPDDKFVVTTVVQRAREELHADDAEDQENEATEQQYRCHCRDRTEQRAHEHLHPGHAVDRTQRAEHPNRTQRGDRREIVAVARELAREDRGDPARYDDSEVEPVPHVTEVRAAVEDEALRDDLERHLCREHVEAAPRH